MPTYKNVSSIRKEVSGKVVEPNKEVNSLVYYDENSVGLLKTSDHPMFNPVLLSERYTIDSEIVIPKVDNLKVPVSKYAIHFCVQSGEVTVRFNSLENNPPLHLYANAKWNLRCFERTIDKILVSGNGSPFTLYIIIEKI